MSDDEPPVPRLPRYRDLPVPVDEAARPQEERRGYRPPEERGVWPGPRPVPDRPGDGPTGPRPPDDGFGPAPPSGSGPLAPDPGVILARRSFKIALWGATGSGKTLFLQMLPTAAQRMGWVETPIGPASERFFGDAARGLVDEDASLPAATQDKTLLRLQLDKIVPKVLPARLRLLKSLSRRHRRRLEPARIVIETFERPGGDFADLEDDVIEDLLGSDAIIFLYDPTFDMHVTHGDEDDEDDRPSTFDFLGRCLDALRGRSRERLAGGDLPQVVAVCVTKLDALPVFSLARRGFWVTQDDEKPHSPRVADEHAKGFFTWLCSQQEMRRPASGVVSEIDRKFPPDRTRFFVTSAAGFRRTHDEGAVDLADPDNVQDLVAENGMTRRLWSKPHPINVMEPIVALYEMAREARR